MLLIARGLKSYTGLGSTDKSIELINNANKLRVLRTDSGNNLASVEKLISYIDPSIIQASNRAMINPWEISLALANPYYYDQLYNLEGSWAKRSVKCLVENIISNINAISNEHPNTKFLVIGIPDKFFWSEVSYESTIHEYKSLGYKFRSRPINLRNNPLSLLVKNKLKSESIEFIYLPSIVDTKTDVSDWFYYRDMHINNKGNRGISAILKGKTFW